MRLLRLYRALVLWMFLTSSLLAAVRPSFSLDDSSWTATHIVVAITTEPADAFEVVESWKGDLRVGDRVFIPELRPSPSDVPVSQYSDPFDPHLGTTNFEGVPVQPLGSSVILFLKKAKQANGGSSHIEPSWEPTNLMNSMPASVIWVDGSQLYCNMQPWNPGPSYPVKCGTSLEKARDRVSEIEDIQQKVLAIDAISDPRERAEELGPYAKSGVVSIYRFALEQLGSIGPPAVPALLNLLDDPTQIGRTLLFMDALVTAGGDSVGPEIDARLKGELSFWRRTGPTLNIDWQRQDGMIGDRRMSDYWGRLYYLLWGIERSHYYSGAAPTISQIRDLWISLSALSVGSEPNQIVEECENLIAKSGVK